MSALLLLVALCAAGWQPEMGEYEVLHSSGPLPGWALSQLTNTGGQGTAFAALEAALPRANAYERRLIAAALKRPRTARQLEPLKLLARDPDRETRQAALRALDNGGPLEAVLFVSELVADRRYPERTLAAKILPQAWRYDRRMEDSGRPLSYRTDLDAIAVGSAAVAALTALAADPDPKLRAAAAASLHEFRFYASAIAPVYAALLVDKSSEPRRNAIYYLPSLGGPETTEVLAGALASPDDWVRGGAARALRDRGDDRGFEILLSTARAIADGWRYSTLRDLGAALGRKRLEDLLGRHERARDARELEDYALVLHGVYAPGLKASERAVLSRFADGSPSAATRELARALLDKRDSDGSAPPPKWLRFVPSRRTLMLAACAFCAAAGLFMFLCGWRLLQLRRLALDLPTSPARSVPMGLVAVRGRAEAVAGGGPLMRSDCDGSFWVVDEGGRVLVESAGGALLSADGSVRPGEAVRVIGVAEPGKDGQPVIRLPARKKGAAERLYAAAAWLLLGLGPYGRTGRMLFEDPRRVLWVWDDAGKGPMASEREAGLLAAAFVLGGAWLTAFFAAALSVIRAG